MRSRLYHPDRDALVAVLRDLRVKQNLRQSELAARLQRPQSFISKVESGQRRVDLLELREWCEALDADLVDIVTRWVKATPR